MGKHYVSSSMRLQSRNQSSQPYHYDSTTLIPGCSSGNYVSDGQDARCTVCTEGHVLIGDNFGNQECKRCKTGVKHCVWKIPRRACSASKGTACSQAQKAFRHVKSAGLVWVTSDLFKRS